MPACINCNHFDKVILNCKLKCDKRGRSHTRNCVTAIWREEKPFCKGNILEVGGGQWNAPRKALRVDPNCKYFGIDPRWGNSPILGGYRGSVCKMPFQDNFFDRVLAFETMEHWGQSRGNTVEQGIKEIYRVLKTNGVICITVPIHLHGTSEFKTGDMNKIKGYFDKKLWEDIKFEEWRKDYEPLPPSRNWVGSLEYYSKYSTQKVPSSWCLRINAKKS